MKLPKTTPFDNEGQTDVLRLHETGWVVTSGNISTGSDFGKFPWGSGIPLPTDPPPYS